MADKRYGLVLGGDEAVLRASYEAFDALPVDQTFVPEDLPSGRPNRTTLAGPVCVTGPGTFFGKAQRCMTLEPSLEQGWWFDRTDLPDQMSIQVTVHNVWTTVRNIVLLSGSPHNYMRMVEHIVALRLGLGLDGVMVRQDSGDPPLFDRSSLELVEAVERAGVRASSEAAALVTVKEPVTMVSKSGRFLTFLPAEPDTYRLDLDCAIDFNSAIGRQRIVTTVTPETFRHGAFARTNTTLLMVLYCKTLGMVFADTRNLGYTPRNLLIAGWRRYANRPRLRHNGKALEAVWHRAMLDLLAAVALIDQGRFVGKIVSYKAGHRLDVEMVRELVRGDWLVAV